MQYQIYCPQCCIFAPSYLRIISQHRTNNTASNTELSIIAFDVFMQSSKTVQKYRQAPSAEYIKACIYPTLIHQLKGNLSPYRLAMYNRTTPD